MTPHHLVARISTLVYHPLYILLQPPSLAHCQHTTQQYSAENYISYELQRPKPVRDIVRSMNEPVERSSHIPGLLRRESTGHHIYASSPFRKQIRIAAYAPTYELLEMNAGVLYNPPIHEGEAVELRVSGGNTQSLA